MKMLTDKQPILVLRDVLLRVIDTTPTSAFITFHFYKKDGSYRILNGRFGVKKHLHGGKPTVDVSKYYIVWENKTREYRAVNKKTICKFIAGGKVYTCKVNPYDIGV